MANLPPFSHLALIARKRILVIESAPEVIVKLLRADGHLALNAPDEPSALSLWERAAGGFDIVIVDDRVLNPARLIGQFLSSKPTIRLILMLAKPPPAEFQSPNIIVLLKPVSPSKLTEAIAAE